MKRASGRTLGFWGVATGGVTLATIISLSPLPLEADLIAFISAGLIVTIACQVARGRLDIFDPLSAFILCWFVLFVARPVAMMITGNFNFLTYDVKAGFLPMLAMATAGELGFLSGYAVFLGSRFGKHLKALPSSWSTKKATLFSIALAGLGTALFTAAVLRAGGARILASLLEGRQVSNIPFFTSSSAYLYYGIYFTIPATLFLITSGVAFKKRALVFAGLLLLAITLALILPSGTRSWILPACASPLVFFYLHKDSRPGIPMTLVSGFLIFLVGIAFLGAVRNTDGRSIGLEALVAQDVTQLSAAWDQFISGGDTEMASLLALEAEFVPNRIPFQHGTATGEIVVQPIPRQLWPDKPRPGDEMLTHQLLIDPGLSVAPRQFTPMASFYLDFGFIGVFLGMIALGLLARAHYEYFTANKQNPAVQMVYAATFPFWFVLLRGSVSDTSGRLLFIVLPLVIGLVVASQTKRKTDPRKLPTASAEYSR